jgi:pantoate--beta-alanine ligase
MPPMQVIDSNAALRAALAARSDVVLVPTMGNLHAGHLALLELARRQLRSPGGAVVVSLFVNPLQFGPSEDFARYPRTFERDRQLLAAAGCDVLFAPSVEEMYPVPQSVFVVPPPPLADILEGASRPGFFRGVCTVVLKLLNIVAPRMAVFGRKDYQQWRVVERMVEQLSLPVEILAGETVREADGLAMSSRNAYLDAGQRREAGALYAALDDLARQVRLGRRDLDVLEREARAALGRRGWRADYVSVRRRADLTVPSAGEAGEAWVVLGAGWLGATRLIDNLEI